VRRDGDMVAVVCAHAVAGLDRQTRVPDHVFGGPDALARAASTGAGWIWLLASGADPHADALQRLLDARAIDGEQPASLLSGMVVGASGRAVDAGFPTGDGRSPADLIRLAGKRMLPIRFTAFANCLVAGDCFVRHGLPDRRRYGPYAAIEWSARALRDDAGYFVPASVVVLRPSVGRPFTVAAIPGLSRMLATGVWTRGEALGNITSLGRAAFDVRSAAGRHGECP
jgi:hypothetical protein